MKIHVQRTEGDGLIECQQKDEIASLKEKITKIDKTLFLGNGKPSMMTQMAVMQQTIYALTWLAAVTLTAVIGQIVFLAFKALAK